MEILESRSNAPGERPQDILVEEFCERARAVLRSAPDKPSARALAVELCAKFSDECTSVLIVNAARGYIEQWIDKRWGGGADAHRP